MNEGQIHAARMAFLMGAFVLVVCKSLCDIVAGLSIPDPARRDSHMRYAVFCSVVHASVVGAAVVGYTGARSIRYPDSHRTRYLDFGDQITAKRGRKTGNTKEDPCQSISIKQTSEPTPSSIPLPGLGRL